MLLHAADYLKDNRLPPEGFTNTQADLIEPQTKPSGIGNDGDFNMANNLEGSGTDTVHYRVTVNDPNAAYAVDVRLLYQTIQPGFIDGLQINGSLVNEFKQMVAQLAPSVEVLVSGSAILPAIGGGCTINSNASVDPIWPLLLIIPGIGYFRRRAINNSH